MSDISINTLIERLERWAEDPMWSCHAEVPKPLLSEAARTIRTLQNRVLFQVEMIKQLERKR